MADSETFEGTDGDRTPRIELTAAEYDDPNIRFDLGQLRDLLDADANAQDTYGSSLIPANLALTVEGWRNVELYVDGTATKITPLGSLFTDDDEFVDCDDIATTGRLAWAHRDGAGGRMISANGDTQAANNSLASNTIIRDELDAIIQGDLGNSALYGAAGDDLDFDVIDSGFNGTKGAPGAISDSSGYVIFDDAEEEDKNMRVGPRWVQRTGIAAGSDVIVVTVANLGFYIALNANNGNEGPRHSDGSVSLAGLYDMWSPGSGDGGDVFVGSGIDQVFDGTDGEDITGGATDDLLFNGTGNDTPRSTNGHERIEVVVGEYGVHLTGGDILISGGGGADRLIDNGTGISTDLDEGRYQGTTGVIGRIEFANPDAVPTREMPSTVAEQLIIPDDAGDDVISLLALTTPDFDISDIASAYNPSTGVWTISYTGPSGPATVTFSASQIVGDAPYGFTSFFVDSDIWAKFVSNTEFAGANLIDGGTGQNGRLTGSEGSDVIFGGENSADPPPDMATDDFIYGDRGNDILIGGSGYDTYHLGRGWGDDLIIDGNGPVGANANGLILFTGLDPSGNFVGGSVIGDNYKYQGNGVWTTGDAGGSNGVRFADNADGTWTLSFNEGSGSVTFAAEEITGIDLYSYDQNGVTSNVDRFVYDAANSRYDLAAYEFDAIDIDVFYTEPSNIWSLTFTGHSGLQTVHLSSSQITRAATWDPNQNLKTIFDKADFTGANFINGGLGQNDLIDVPARTNIVFGGSSALDPAPDGPVDDHLYSSQEGDILVGGKGFDVYQVGRGQGDNIIIEGNGPVNGHANKLVLTPDFNVNGEFDAGTVTGDHFTDQGGGVWTTGDYSGQNGVTFTNNPGGTWTIAFNEGGGSVTFAAEEISAIELQSYGAGGVFAGAHNFVYDPVADEYAIV